LTVSAEALRSIDKRFEGVQQPRELLEYEYENGSFRRSMLPPKEALPSGDLLSNFALFHPAAAFETKQWAPENFARIAEYLAAHNIKRVAIATRSESGVLQRLTESSRVPIVTLNDLSLPEITALASRARLFVGNDSGIAHIAAAVGTPTVVIFGSSNRNHWRPWTDAPNEIVFEEYDCQPCAGYECAVFGAPNCILSVRPETAIAAIDRVLEETNKGGG
jgi:ADP-heptose:LPS heptosyltransferase